MIFVTSLLGAGLACTFIRPADNFFYVFYALMTFGLIGLTLFGYLDFFRTKTRRFDDFSSPAERSALSLGCIGMILSVFCFLIIPFWSPAIGYESGWSFAALGVHSVLLIPGLRLTGTGVTYIREYFGYLSPKEGKSPPSWGSAGSLVIAGTCLCLLDLGLYFAACSLGAKVAAMLSQPL